MEDLNEPEEFMSDEKNNTATQSDKRARELLAAEQEEHRG